MTKIKSIIAICIVVTIISTCALSAAASLSSSTSVIWNARETAAKAQTVGSGPSNTPFHVYADIESTSTGDFEFNYTDSKGITSTISTTTAYVDVTYPSEIPLVHYSGYHGYGNFYPSSK